MENIILEIGLSIFTENSSINKDLIKGFGKVKIENYEKMMDLGQRINESDYKAIYFNEEQANKIEEQINEDKNWTKREFDSDIINKYVNNNVKEFNNCYYYLIEFDRDYHIVETNRDILDKKKVKWYNSAIYDSDNNVLYYFCKYYEK